MADPSADPIPNPEPEPNPKSAFTFSHFSALCAYLPHNEQSEAIYHAFLHHVEFRRVDNAWGIFHRSDDLKLIQLLGRRPGEPPAKPGTVLQDPIPLHPLRRYETYGHLRPPICAQDVPQPIRAPPLKPAGFGQDTGDTGGTRVGRVATPGKKMSLGFDLPTAQRAFGYGGERGVSIPGSGGSTPEPAGRIEPSPPGWRGTLPTNPQLRIYGNDVLGPTPLGERTALAGGPAIAFGPLGGPAPSGVGRGVSDAVERDPPPPYSASDYGHISGRAESRVRRGMSDAVLGESAGRQDEGEEDVGAEDSWSETAYGDEDLGAGDRWSDGAWDDDEEETPPGCETQ